MDDAAERAAVQDPPVAGSDHADVLAGSRRLARRRRLVTGGVAAAVIALAGGGATGVVLSRDGGALTLAAAPAHEAAPVPGALQAVPAPDGAAPEQAGRGSAADAAVPRAAAAPPGDPLGPAAGDCVNPQDPQLRALVDEALPALAAAREAPTTMICRPAGGREVNLEVTDAALTGLFTVVYTPRGEPPVQTGTAVGWATAKAPTASGGTVVVTSRGAADSGGVPFADRVPALAEALGPRL
ncbi:hypothetical protein ACL02T_21665 [Pseudonocardia sp. RS010]|uniref:hypothetical protein n=1 Tax=Pseudonocardia sp. RS010 TaxID=3385979 RepID=UPI0039A24389